MMYYNHIFAALLIRLFLGILFLSQGYDKIFRLGVKRVIDAFDNPLENRQLPKWLIIFAGGYTSYVEFVCGVLLILGLFKNIALYLLGVDLLMVCFAFSIMKPMWDMQYVFPRLVMLVGLLVIPYSWDVLSLDYVFKITQIVKSILVS